MTDMTRAEALNLNVKSPKEAKTQDAKEEHEVLCVRCDGKKHKTLMMKLPCRP